MANGLDNGAGPGRDGPLTGRVHVRPVGMSARSTNLREDRNEARRRRGRRALRFRPQVYRAGR